MAKWTKEEITLLRENMDKALNSLKEILPQKTDEQILEKIKLIYRQTPSTKWTPEEDSVILNNKNFNAHDLMKLIPHRSYYGILSRRITLIPPTYSIVRTPFTKEEIETLSQLRKDGFTLHEMSEIMNRSLNSIKAALYNNNLTRKYGKQTLWTKEQEIFIIENIKKGNTVEYIAKALGSEYKKVVNKALHLGFTYKQIMTDVKVKNKSEKSNLHIKNSRIKDLELHIKTLNKTIKQLERN